VRKQTWRWRSVGERLCGAGVRATGRHVAGHRGARETNGNRKRMAVHERYSYPYRRRGDANYVHHQSNLHGGSVAARTDWRISRKREGKAINVIVLLFCLGSMKDLPASASYPCP